MEGKQVKVLMPTHLYAALKSESKNAGVTMADLVRLAVAARYGYEYEQRVQLRLEEEKRESKVLAQNTKGGLAKQ